MSTKAVSRPQQQQSGKATTTSNFTKRKPVNLSAAGTSSTASPTSSSSSPTYTSSPRAANDIVSTSTLTPPSPAQATATAVESPFPHTTTAGPGSVVMGGMAKPYEESQKDLFAKLEALATASNPVPKKTTTDSPIGNIFGSHLKVTNYGGTNRGNKSISFNGQQSSSSSSQPSFQQQLKQTRGGNSQSSLGQGYGGNNSNHNNNNTYHGASSTASMSSYTPPKAPERPRE